MCPGLLKRFYHSLCKWISPACSIVPSGTWEILEKMISTTHIPFDSIQFLYELSPVLSDLVSYITTISHERERYGVALVLLEHMLNKAQGCFIMPD